jgi:hypothetical protein
MTLMQINARVIAGDKYYRALSHIPKKRYITRSLRVSLYKTIIRPVMICGAR